MLALALFHLVALAEAARLLPVTHPHEQLNPLDHFAVGNAHVAIDDAIHISADTPVLTTNGQWVEVTWSGVELPAFDDYVAVYEAGADPRHTAPIKFQLAARSPGYLTLGLGSTKYCPLATHCTQHH
jgi:hypothetical protein